MSWQDRLIPPVLVTPDGVRHFFEYENVSSEGENKTSQYQFSDQNNALVQNFGQGIYKLPLTIMINGPDYDIDATKLEKALGLPGNSILEHPLYGVHTVVVETWKRSDKLASEANEVVFALTITKTIAEQEPEAVARLESEIIVIILESPIINGNIAAGLNVKKPSLLSRALARIKKAISKFRQAMAKVLDKSALVRAVVETAIATIEGGLSSLLLTPAVLFSAIGNLVRLPARIFTRLSDKVKAYKSLLDGFLDSTTSGTDADSKNQKIEAQVFTNAYTAALADAYLFASENSAAAAQKTGIDDAVIEAINSGSGFVTRDEATTAAANLIEQMRQVQEKNDLEQRESETTDLANRYVASDQGNQLLTKIVQGTASVLLSLAFQLRQQREVTLLNDTTLINLCYELYGSTLPNTLDFFIGTNNLVDDEFFVLPKDRVIRYYV